MIAATGAELGVLTVPSESAQAVADALVAAGIRGLLELRSGGACVCRPGSAWSRWT